MFEARAEGFVGNDPDMKEVVVKGEKRKVLNFRIAVSNNQPEPKKKTLWFNVALWGKMAEDAAGVLSRGNRVLVEAFWMDAAPYGENQVNLSLQVKRFYYAPSSKNGSTGGKSDEDYQEIAFDEAEMALE
jgi:single-stranded DNA-binding protein